MAIAANMSRNAKQFHILAAGPIVLEGGMTPRRIVLRKKDGGFVTHYQGLRGRGEKLHDSFVHGHYFMNCDGGPDVALAKAVKDFCERVTEHTLGTTVEQLSTL